MKSATFYIIISFLFTMACNNSSEPCDYDIKEVEAQIKSIEPYSLSEYPEKHDANDTLYHVILDFDGSSLASEDQYLEQIKNVKIDSDFINRHKLKIGNIYKATISELISGNCEPLYVSFDAGLSR